LLTHSSIADAAVIGVYSNEDATEYPVAYVVLQQDEIQSDQMKEEIKNFVFQRVAQHKRLRGGVYFIDKIPKSPSGKILRRLLRERAKNECILNNKC
jgi:4-coumarate--CoA ligase